MDKHGFREIQKKLRLTNEGISETMDVELFTVQNWATGAWPIPKAIVKFLHTLVVLSKKEDPLDVYAKGHATGYSRGYSKGSNDGYTAGRQVGYTYGLEDGSSTHRGGYIRGYDIGHKDGKEVGQRRGEKKGYIEGYYIGQGHDGNNNCAGE